MTNFPLVFLVDSSWCTNLPLTLVRLPFTPFILFAFTFFQWNARDTSCIFVVSAPCFFAQRLGRLVDWYTGCAPLKVFNKHTTSGFAGRLISRYIARRTFISSLRHIASGLITDLGGLSIELRALKALTFLPGTADVCTGLLLHDRRTNVGWWGSGSSGGGSVGGRISGKRQIRSRLLSTIHSREKRWDSIRWGTTLSGGVRAGKYGR